MVALSRRYVLLEMLDRQDERAGGESKSCGRESKNVACGLRKRDDRQAELVPTSRTLATILLLDRGGAKAGLPGYSSPPSQPQGRA